MPSFRRSSCSCCPFLLGLTLLLFPQSLALSVEPSSNAGATLSGRFVVDGELAALPPIAPKTDAHCKLAKPKNESVLTGKDGGLMNVVVYLKPRRGQEVVATDSGNKLEPVEIANQGCAFSPRIVLLRTGQPLLIKNADPIGHNTKFSLLKNAGLNQMIPAGDAVTKVFSKAESLPLPITCSIHPYMTGFVLIRDDPYMATTDETGHFQIKGLPAGEHRFQLWHETGYLKNVAYDGGTADRRGRVSLELAENERLDLGEIKVPAASLMP